MKSVEYLIENKSKEERQSHLDLSESCLERGGNSHSHKGVLAQYLNTTIPKVTPRPSYGLAINLCHACHNGKCSNPKHLYWGSVTENNQDAYANGKKSVWQFTVDKYGEETARKMRKLKPKHAGIV